jgi:lysophospholipase L1-like esterase
MQICRRTNPISGYNTDMALRVLDKIVPTTMKDSIRLMTIFFGANDSCFFTDRNNQCVPLPDFRCNLIKIIRTLSARKNPRIILITNPPVDERTQQMIDQSKGYELRRTAENTKLYADAVRNVGNNLEIPVVDLWTEIMVKAGWEPGSDSPLPGCSDLPPNPVLAEYLSDGMLRLSLRLSSSQLRKSRSPSLSKWLQPPFRVSHELYRLQLPRSIARQHSFHPSTLGRRRCMANAWRNRLHHQP